MSEAPWRAELTDKSLRDELDRQHPERVELRAKDADGLRHAFDVLEALWAPTIERARQLPPATLHERVNGEYSFVETLRHLLFAWEAWLRPVLAVPDGYHQWAVAPEATLGDARPPTDTGPELEPVLEVRAEYLTRVRDYLSRATDDDVVGAGAPPPWHPEPESVLYCLRVVLHDEWWHHQFATRDLAIVDGATA